MPGTRTVWERVCAAEGAWEVTAPSGGSRRGLHTGGPECWRAGEGATEQIGTGRREDQEFLYGLHISKVSIVLIILSLYVSGRGALTHMHSSAYTNEQGIAVVMVYLYMNACHRWDYCLYWGFIILLSVSKGIRYSHWNKP